MIQNGLAATLMGICLGLLLFGCVRLRMHFGPILRERYGNWLRQTYWVITILFMVALANLGLISLRTYIDGSVEPMLGLMLEIWFATLAMGIALALILRQLKIDSCETPKE